MAANVPVVRQVALVSLVPQLLLMGLLIYGCYLFGLEDPFTRGTLIYLILSFILRLGVPKAHRQGMKLIKQQKFAEAIPCFESSVAFFARHPWVDKYRFLTLLSSSKMSHREMALCNIAFCYSQLGKGAKAQQYYETILAEYPENGLAQAGLNMLNSMRIPSNSVSHGAAS